VTVIAFIFGGLGLLAVPMNVLMFMNRDHALVKNNPLVDAMRTSTFFFFQNGFERCRRVGLCLVALDRKRFAETKRGVSKTWLLCPMVFKK